MRNVSHRSRPTIKENTDTTSAAKNQPTSTAWVYGGDKSQTHQESTEVVPTTQSQKQCLQLPQGQRQHHHPQQQLLNMNMHMLLEDSDDDLLLDGGAMGGNNQQHANQSNGLSTTKRTPAAVEADSLSEISTQSNLSQHEAKIVAPNVSKLSAHSVVEVRLQSNRECVAVLCAVDVLKMRSGFFHDVLVEQEHKQRSDLQPTSGDAPGILWREAIVVPESSPFEAAAYLESLHEGRALFRGDWNLCWARLSVTWIIDDLVVEYSMQITQQMNKLTSIVKQHHWRVNPNVLAGMRVAAFRKGSNPMPIVITGTVIDTQGIGYSKLRIAFDQDRSSLPSPVGSFMSMNSDDCNNSQQSIIGSINSSTLESRIFKLNNYPSKPPPVEPKQAPRRIEHKQPAAPPVFSSVGGAGAAPFSPAALPDSSRPLVGDISEPFWVQQQTTIARDNNSVWCDPDELFNTTVSRKLLISWEDKVMFWEMTRALIELPEYCKLCPDSAIRTVEDLIDVLKRPEYRVLWIPQASQYLPKDMSSELLRYAYVIPN